MQLFLANSSSVGKNFDSMSHTLGQSSMDVDNMVNKTVRVKEHLERNT